VVQGWEEATDIGLLLGCSSISSIMPTMAEKRINAPLKEASPVARTYSSAFFWMAALIFNIFKMPSHQAAPLRNNAFLKSDPLPYHPTK
jgi:hypothetical protein